LKLALQFTARLVPATDVLTQGAGALNIAGALTLTHAINPNARRGQNWMRYRITASNVDANGQAIRWSQRIIYGDRFMRPRYAQVHLFRWDDDLVWAYDAIADEIAWGRGPDNIVWGNDNIVWGNRDNIVWGNGDNIVWGNAEDRRIAWGTDENEKIVWGVPDPVGAHAGNIVWGNRNDDNIVWGNGVVRGSWASNVVAGFWDDTIVWGNVTRENMDNIVWGNALQAVSWDW
jgi:hypothetical protein